MNNQPSALPPKGPSQLRHVNSEFGDGYHPSGGSIGGVTLTRQGSGVVSHSGSTLRHDEPEVDYDEGSTELYKRIEGKDWDRSLAILERDPYQARTWISRKEHNSNKTRWRLLPLHATCIFRSPLALIETLIAAYPDGPQMKDDQGMLPVHLACRNGASKGVVLTLLNAFPESITVKDRKGRIPLSLVETSSSQNKEAVIVAMKRFQQEVSRGMTFRSGNSIAASQSEAPCAAPEVDYEHRTILFRLVLKKDWSAATARSHSFPDEANTWIVTKGFNGNLRFLPLHKACVLAPPESLIETLVAANIEGAKSKDQDGWLPLHCACFYGASAAVVNTLLVAHPKGAQCKDDEGRLPLHYASLKCAPSGVTDALLTSFPKGAMSKDDEGRLPIHHACSKGAPEGVIDALLKASPKGAQSKDDQGRLPLHHACRKTASERVIRTLLRVYPRAAQIKDDQDKLPIHYACQNGSNASVINVLLATYPESINVKNGFGYTPLAEARAVDNPKMEPVIKVLEKFKHEQDKIKVDSGENTALDAKLMEMAQRLSILESTLASVASLGKDLKANMKKTKDPNALLSSFADKLSSIDMGISSPGVPSSQASRSSNASVEEKVQVPVQEKKPRLLRGLRSPRNKAQN
eukprot:CAMPEP_0119014166 /NCGR_PEP_ID=MMETSP1176-20130426/9389_1 /TAXON_ID=265551 /ORGANISM="Synedropsis recta cf, Strain CCMP1620" /LENGTH=634 /DNA_ID=CAMNT_0006967313 /DNA_START=52 /DNA_END=1956 /DNA_ORIENTATION=+